MNHSQILSIIKQKIGLMILAGLLLAALAFWGVMLLAPKYQSNFDVLVVQNPENFVDSYTLAKSTEHFSKLLSESVATETFLAKVIENYPELGSFLPLDREERMKEWGKMVRPSLNLELGMIHFKVLAADREQAENISRAVAKVLASNNNLFVSENQRIEIRMINAPIVKTNPGIGNLILLTLASFLIGALLILVASFYAAVLKTGQGKPEKAEFFQENIGGTPLAKDSEGNLIDARTGEIISG
jgi:capsular polysaccharide biosynthesis protein